MPDYWGNPWAFPFSVWDQFKMIRVARLTTPFVIFGFSYPWLLQYTTPTGKGNAVGASLVSDTPCISVTNTTPVPTPGSFPYGLAVDPDH